MAISRSRASSAAGAPRSSRPVCLGLIVGRSGCGRTPWTPWPRPWSPRCGRRCSASCSASGWAAARPADQLDPAGAGRRADHAAVRLPGAVPGAVRRQPVHRRSSPPSSTPRPCRHQDHCRRHPRRCRPTTVEAASSAGSNTWQIISKVQLPMARRSLTLAVNQGLIYVLSMVVVGGLVGGGALGLRRGRRLLAERAVRQGPGRRAGDRAAGRDARPDHPSRGPPYEDGLTEARTQRMKTSSPYAGA